MQVTAAMIAAYSNRNIHYTNFCRTETKMKVTEAIDCVDRLEKLVTYTKPTTFHPNILSPILQNLVSYFEMRTLLF